METPAVIELTEAEIKYLKYLVEKECKAILADMEVVIINSLLAKLK